MVNKNMGADQVLPADHQSFPNHSGHFQPTFPPLLYTPSPPQKHKNFSQRTYVSGGQVDEQEAQGQSM